MIKGYILIEKDEGTFFRGAEIWGLDVSEVPYRKARNIFPWPRCCSKRMTLWIPRVPIELLPTLPDVTTADSIAIRRCDRCGTIEPAYMLDGLA